MTFSKSKQIEDCITVSTYFFMSLEGSNGWGIRHQGGLPDPQHTTKAMREQLGKKQLLPIYVSSIKCFA